MLRKDLNASGRELQNLSSPPQTLRQWVERKALKVRKNLRLRLRMARRRRIGKKLKISSLDVDDSDQKIALDRCTKEMLSITCCTELLHFALCCPFDVHNC
mmetsp:Transcript_12881/g.17903  ORF Transcript_12881/g.17903 Transcript_12881/m.17903 type:complete len:101 (-) Transcript_12881:29-331(-)